MASEFNISINFNVTKGYLDHARSRSFTPTFTGKVMFHKTILVPISPTVAATLGISIGGGTPGLAYFVNHATVYNQKLFVSGDGTPFAIIKPGEMIVLRLGLITIDAQALAVGTPDSLSYLEVCVFED